MRGSKVLAAVASRTVNSAIMPSMSGRRSSSSSLSRCATRHSASWSSGFRRIAVLQSPAFSQTRHPRLGNSHLGAPQADAGGRKRVLSSSAMACCSSTSTVSWQEGGPDMRIAMDDRQMSSFLVSLRQAGNSVAKRLVKVAPLLGTTVPKLVGKTRIPLGKLGAGFQPAAGASPHRPPPSYARKRAAGWT